MRRWPEGDQKATRRLGSLCFFQPSFTHFGLVGFKITPSQYHLQQIILLLCSHRERLADRCLGLTKRAIRIWLGAPQSFTGIRHPIDSEWVQIWQRFEVRPDTLRFQSRVRRDISVIDETLDTESRTQHLICRISDVVVFQRGNISPDHSFLWSTSTLRETTYGTHCPFTMKSYRDFHVSRQ